MRNSNRYLLSLLLLCSSATVWGQAPVAPTADANMPSIFEHSSILSEEDVQPANAKSQLFWMRADYLRWVITQEPIAPIILTLPDSLATAQTFPPGSGTPVFPTNNHLDYGTFSGVRLNAGFWFNPARTLGFDTSGFVLENKSIGASFASTGSPILTRYYNNIGNGQETFLQFSNPDPATGYAGSVSSVATTTNLYNFDGSLRWNGYRIFSDNTDYLYGFRYMKFDESLNISSRANFQSGGSLTVEDRYRVRNSFFGAQFGVASRWVGLWRFSVDSTLKLAVGGVQQHVSVRGDNAFISPTGQVDSQAVGLWATQANIGTYNRNRFAVIPELNLNLNYSVTDHCAIFVGYSAMIISNVVRVSSAINPNVNQSTVRYIQNTVPSTAPNPGFQFNDTGMWLNGINFGVRLEY